MDEQAKLSRADLRSVATYQKGIITCILVYLIAIASQFVLPQPAKDILFIGLAGLGVIAISIVATVFVFLLATKVYTTGIGVLLGILTLVPIVGLFALLVINGKATTILKNHGIRVGLLGANASDLDRQ
jgi:hypothetical protein